MELWDAYDDQLNQIPDVTLTPGEVLPEVMYHLVSEILVQHSDGTFLLIQRPNEQELWVATANGPAHQRESHQDCAIRVLSEKTGICSNADTTTLTPIGLVLWEDHRVWYAEYLCNTSQSKDELKKNAKTPDIWKWVTEETLREMTQKDLISTRFQAFLWKEYESDS